MKKILALLLALMVLFSACSNSPTPEATVPSTSEQGTTGPSTEPTDTTVTEPGDTTEPDATQPTTEPEPVYRPDLGIYQPESDIEKSTGGAVKYFRPDLEAFHDIALLGDGVLLFSEEGEDTRLTLYREEEEPVSIVIPVFVGYDDGREVGVGPKGVTYYDDNTFTVVFLDTSLQEVNRVELSCENVGAPAVSADWSYIYYLTPSELMCYEVATGISRVRKSCNFDSQFITGLHFNDSVLEFNADDGDNLQSLFIHAQTGETLYVTEGIPMLDTQEEWFFMEQHENGYPELVYGTRDGERRCLIPATDVTSFYPLAARRSAAVAIATQFGCVLELYGLEEGTRNASVVLSGLTMPWAVTADTERGIIWFLVEMPGGEAGLFCWDDSASKVDDDTDRTSPYYTREEPDLEGLARIEENAKAIGKKYGVRIKVYEDAVASPPEDFTFASAWQVPLYERYLPMLDEALASYPKDFLKRLGQQSDNGKVTICLVLGCYGDNALGAISTADGVQYMLDGNQYVVVNMNGFMCGTLYHELFHAMDVFIMNRVNTFDWWDDLNPKGFKYDNDYIQNQYREDYQYLEPDTRAFIDMYSMSFAKEDRARIMEYAMQEGNAEYFSSPIMQKKLKTLCEGIRKAFGLQKYKDPLIWEQYLQ